MTSNQVRALGKAQLPGRLDPAWHHGLWATLEVWNTLALMYFLGGSLGPVPCLWRLKILTQGAYLFLESKVAGLGCGKLREGFIIVIRRAGDHCLHPPDF